MPTSDQKEKCVKRKVLTIGMKINQWKIRMPSELAD